MEPGMAGGEMSMDSMGGGGMGPGGLGGGAMGRLDLSDLEQTGQEGDLFGLQQSIQPTAPATSHGFWDIVDLVSKGLITVGQALALAAPFTGGATGVPAVGLGVVGQGLGWVSRQARGAQGSAVGRQSAPGAPMGASPGGIGEWSVPGFAQTEGGRGNPFVGQLPAFPMPQLAQGNPFTMASHG